MDDPPSSPGALIGQIDQYAGLLTGSGGLGNPIDIQFGWLLWAVIILFSLSFLFSGLEAAIFSFGRYRLRELVILGDKRASRLSKLFENPERLMGVLIILNITANVILAALWTSGSFRLARDLKVTSSGLFVLVSDIILAIILILFAEITPKSIFTKYSEKISLAFTPLMIFLYRIIGPIGTLLESIAKVILLPFKQSEKTKEHFVTEKELKDLVTVGESEGILDRHEKEMIHSIFEFGDRQVKEVMVEREKIVGIKKGTSLKEAMRIIVESGFSRLPVYKNSLDSIVGIMMSKDILPMIGRGQVSGATVDDLMRGNVYFVPETRLVRDLFDEFQRKKIYMAIAVDASGKTAGLITTEDMLEEIVGEIEDEYDIEEPSVIPQKDGSYVVDGEFSIQEFADMFGISIDGDEHETVGRFVQARLGESPEVGLKTKGFGLDFEIMEFDENHIPKLRVRRLNENDMKRGVK